MPYIKTPRRIAIQPILDMMMAANVQPNGEINYMLNAYFKRISPKGYNEIKNFLAELHEAEEEIRRRYLVPYEEKKIEDNGDV